MRMAQGKIDELIKMSFTTAPAIAVGGSLDADTADYFEEPEEGVTIRWLVEDGPVEDTRIVTVRVLNTHAQQYRETDLTTIIRQW